MAAGIYIIQNKIDSKMYVGSTNNFNVRWKRHILDLNKRIHTGQKLQRAWIKYGQDSFEFKIIEHVKDLTILLQREQHWLDLLKVVKFGYNVLPTAGNNSGYKLSEAHKEALSFKGRHHTNESKVKMSLAAKNRVISDETKAKMRTAKLGKKGSEEMKAKMRIIATGRKHSEETKAKMSQSRKGKPRFGPPKDYTEWYANFMKTYKSDTNL